MASATFSIYIFRFITHFQLYFQNQLLLIYCCCREMVINVLVLIDVLSGSSKY